MKLPEFLSKLKLNKGPEKNKLISIALVFLLILYLDFSLIIKLQFKLLKNVTDKITKVDKQLDVFAKDTAAIEELKRSSLGRSKTGGALKVKKAIKEEELPLLLQDISDMANKNNVKIIQVKPSRDIKQNEGAAPGKKLSPLTIALGLSCGYHSLGSFINQLESLSVFLAVEEIKIRQGSGDYMSQNVDLMLKTYANK